VSGGGGGGGGRKEEEEKRGMRRERRCEGLSALTSTTTTCYYYCYYCCCCYYYYYYYYYHLHLCRQQLDSKSSEVQKLREKVVVLSTTMKTMIAFIQDSAEKASRGLRFKGDLFETDEVRG